MHLGHILLESVPVWLNDLKHHVIFKILYKVEHALPQGKSWEVPSVVRQRINLGLFIAYPDTVEYNKKYM